MSELRKQMDIGDFLPEAKPAGEPQEGYDERGALLDYAPQTPAEDAERLHEIATEINAITEQARGVVISAALAVGKRLLEAKGLVPRGRFGEWLARNVDCSERKAQDMMRLYEQYGRDDVPEAIARLDYSKAVALLAAPEEAREALAERAVADDMSVRDLQEEIKQLKIEKVKSQLSIQELEGKVEHYDRELSRKVESEQLYDTRVVEMQQELKAQEEISQNLMDSLEEADARAKEQQEAMRQLQERVERAKSKADAAEVSAEALRKERDKAKRSAEASAQRAGDAVRRANETQEKLRAAEERLKELEARPAEVKVVEQVKLVEPAVARFRLSFERLTSEFKAAEALLQEVRAENAEEGARYTEALKRACEMMIGRLGA